MWLAAGTALTAAFFLLPAEGLASNLLYNVIGALSSVMILIGVRLHDSERRAMWYWFAAGQITWVLGDLTWEYYVFVLHEEPYPSFADAFYLAAYPMLMIGLFQLVRGRAGRDLAGLVDAAIVGTGLGLVFWVFVMHPLALGSSASPLERIVGVAYPAIDVLLLAMLARLYASAQQRTPSVHLLGVAGVFLLVGDVGYALVSLYSENDDSSLLNAGFLLSYVAWGAAALHPSMRSAGAQTLGSGQYRVGRSRLATLAVSSLLAPALLLVPDVGGDTLDRVVIGAAAAALFLLVVFRMSGFVSQVQRQAARLEDLAMEDDLTGLANRRRLEQAMRAALADGPVQVALLDLDDFKGVNDRLGHAVGDQLLTVLAGRLVTAMPEDALVARMGGDEFAIMMPGASDAAADLTVSRLAETLRTPIRVEDYELLLNASIGVTDGAGTTNPFEVLRRADVAMYEAKESGSGYCRFAEDLDEEADEQARLGAELREALDAGQFRMAYQPIVELPHGRVVGVEALVRWDHPTRGLVPPDRFIPAAERNGLIVELGEWILRTACAQAVAWRAELGDRAPYKISVNVSARQLAEPGFSGLVAATLAETGLPAARLTVEVTETAVFGGSHAVQALEEVHALGVSIALDDFGTGHSSLGLLQTVPVDVLKVDKSFVDNITMAGRHAVIATALIQVSTGLGLTAVAEGVETAEQAAELHRLGYRLAQGYHFGKPSAAPEFTVAAAGAVRQ
jgi:diguanylate cyclase (GGDEF)-like protein